MYLSSQIVKYLILSNLKTMVNRCNLEHQCYLASSNNIWSPIIIAVIVAHAKALQ